MSKVDRYLEHGDDSASTLAAIAHYGQTRKFGDDEGLPYIIHPTRVADNFPKGSILSDAAYLHDVVEDTDWTFEDLLGAGIRPEVIVILRFVTKMDGEEYADFIMRILKNREACELKIADITDNLKSLKAGRLKSVYRLARHILRERLKEEP